MKNALIVSPTTKPYAREMVLERAALRQANSLERMREKIRQGNDLISRGRSSAIEWSVAIDSVLSAIISEYFVENESKRSFFKYDILSILAASQKLSVFENLETRNGVPYKKRYKGLVERLWRLNSYRNRLVHGYPSVFDKTEIWSGRGKLKPVSFNQRLVHRMDSLAERTCDNLYGILKRMMR